MKDHSLILGGHFLQSKEWEGFQRALGREVFRADEILFIKLPLAFGKSYLYSAGVWREFVREVKDIARRSNAVFFKCEPMVEDGGLARELLRAGFAKSKKEVQPQKTIILDLAKSEEELLAGMHEKTRYNIRVGGRHGVKFSNLQTLEKFWELLQKTSGRDKFYTHPKEYYEKLLELPTASLFTAEYQDKTIAANIVLFHGETAYYLHGASDHEYRSLMAPHLLHWETIKYAQANGYKKYDFWGIDEQKWPGVTRFKRGFGGREINYIGSYDYVFQPFWYLAYNLRNKIKNLR